MTSAWAGLGFSADGAMEALSATSVHVVESDARTRVEVARAEFRNGKVDAGFATLDALVDGLRPLSPDDVSSEGIDLAFAIANSVLGQGWELIGETTKAADAFQESVRRFEGLDDTLLNPRDHSDYGVALAAVGNEFGALEHLLSSRRDGGATPEAARHHAVLLMGGGKTHLAEELLKEALLTTPADPDALRALGMIQADRDDPAAPATLASAVYALMKVGRYGEAIDVLDFLEPRTPGSADLTGVRAEAERLDDRLDAALASYERALQQRPDQPWLLAGVASTLLALGRAEAAEEYVSTAVDSRPDSIELLDLAGEIAARTEDWERVGELARRAIALNAQDTSARYRLALALRDDDPEEACEVIKTARAFQPTNFDFLALHAELALKVSPQEVAAELFRQLCADSRASLSAHLTLIWLLQATGQTSSGIAAVETALTKFDDREPLLLYLSELVMVDDPARAFDALRRAVALPDHGVEATMALADALFQIDDLSGALAEIDQAKLEAPDSSGVYELEARVLAYDGSWELANTAALRALELDPTSADAMTVLGRAALAADELEEAASWLRKAVEHSTHMTPRYFLAQALIDSAPAEARPLLDEIIEANGLWVIEALKLRARLQLNRGKLPKAIADLEQAADLAPDDASTLAELADALRQGGDSGRALEVVNRSLELDPESPFTLVVRGTAYQQLGRLEEARADLYRAIELSPTYGYAHILLARVAEDTAKAQEHVDAARELMPGDSLAEIEQARLYIQTQSYPEALETYERLLESSREPEVVGGHIDVLRLLGRVEESVLEGERALVELGDDPVVRRTLAISLVEVGRRADGIAQLTKLEESVGDASSKSDLAWALNVNEEQDRALAKYDEALLAAPYDLWTRNQIANLLAEVGDYHQALAFADGSLELDPTSVDTLAQIGWAARQMDPPDFARALDAFERAEALLPDADTDVWLLAALAECRHLLGDPRAEEGFRKALALGKSPASKGFRNLSTAGWCAYRLGELTQASRLFLEGASLEDKPGSDSFDLALVTLCLPGRGDRARKLYADAVRLVGEARHPLIQRGLIQVAVIDINRAQSGHDLDPSVTASILADLEQALAGLPQAPQLAASPTLPA